MTNYNKQIFRVSGSYNFMKSAKVDKNYRECKRKKLVSQIKNVIHHLIYGIKGSGGVDTILSLTLGCSVFICCPMECIEGIDDAAIFVVLVAAGDDLS